MKESTPRESACSSCSALRERAEAAEAELEAAIDAATTNWELKCKYERERAAAEAREKEALEERDKAQGEILATGATCAVSYLGCSGDDAKAITTTAEAWGYVNQALDRLTTSRALFNMSQKTINELEASLTAAEAQRDDAQRQVAALQSDMLDRD